MLSSIKNFDIPNFICRELDNIKVKGKEKPVKIYEVVDNVELNVNNTSIFLFFVCLTVYNIYFILYIF